MGTTNKNIQRQSHRALAALVSGLMFSGCTAGFQTMDHAKRLAASEASSQQATPEFAPAKAVLERNCTSCHSSGGRADFAPMNFQFESEFIQAGLIVPGDVDQSKLIHRVQGYSGPGPGADVPFSSNMPLNSSISAQDLSILKAWVVALGKKDQEPVGPYQPFACNDTDKVVANNLRRLSQKEMINTIGDLVVEFGGSEASNIQQEISVALQFLPKDDEVDLKKINYGITRSHIDAYWQVAKDLSESVTKDNSRISTLAGSCFTQSSVSDNCLNSFIDRFGLWTYRRPVTASERSSLNSFYKAQVSEFALANLVARFLLSPQFLYHLEVEGSDAGPANELKLTSYELASKLSYQLRGTMPNQMLFDAAASGKLSDPAQLQAVVDDLFANDPKVKTQVRSFFSHWLEFDSLASFDTSSQKLLALAGDLNLSQNASALQTAMISEVDAMLIDHLWENPTDYKSLLTSRKAYTDSPLLNQLYSIPTAVGGQYTFPQTQRSGLLTRAAFLVSGDEKTDPIHIGVKMYRDVLCQELPPPPGGVDTSSPSGLTELNASHREIVADMTSKPACIDCHSKINPLGFAFENFDPFGRHRNPLEEKVFDDQGNLVKIHATSASTTPEISRDMPRVSVRDSVQLMDEMADSQRADACLVRTYHRYTNKRAEDEQVDGCSMKSMYDQLNVSGGTMQDMFKARVLESSFGLRRYNN